MVFSSTSLSFFLPFEALPGIKIMGWGVSVSGFESESGKKYDYRTY